MNDVEHDLPPRLHELADHLAGRSAVSTESVVERYRRRRRTRAGLLATAAAVVAIAVGVPVAGANLSSAPVQPAAPAPLTTSPTPDSAPDHSNPEAIAEAETRAAEAAAAAAAAQAAAQADLEAVRAQLPAQPVLTSPADWDRWLPEGKPYPGASTAEDIATCPVLSDRLSAALGQRMSYWKGTLPGSGGCTWVPVPLKYGPDPYDYAYVLTVNFVGDGTTIDWMLRTGFLDGVPEGRPVPCPRLAVGDGVLVRCDGGIADTGPNWTLLLPDARGAGVWLLTAEARVDAAHTSAEAFLALVDGVLANYG